MKNRNIDNKEYDHWSKTNVIRWVKLWIGYSDLEENTEVFIHNAEGQIQEM